MVLTSILLAALQVDPYRLNIGRPGEVMAQPGFIEARRGARVTAQQVAAAADGHRYILLGETHDNPDHHKMQAEVIDALVERGRDVTVGFEMFTRDNQRNMDAFTYGMWDEAEFIARSNWQTQWGFPFEIYRPIFQAVQRHKLPMAALNLPRDWVRLVGREGPGALSIEQAVWAPNIDTSSKEHRRVFEALIGGHPLQGQRGENMYAAQVSWDEAMAQSAVDYMHGRTGRRPIMAIIAGSGHVMYDVGINLRLAQKGWPSVSVTSIDGVEPRPVSRGLGDFVFMAPPPARPAR